MLFKAKFYLPLFLLICGFGMPDLQAQQNSQQATFLKISPQHFAINGMHFELERQFSAQSPNTIIISPRVYYGSVSNAFTNRFTSSDDQLAGYGLELGYRIYADKATNKPQGFYSAFAANYHHFQFKYNGQESFEYIGEDGLKYIGVRDARVKENVNRYGGSVTMGYQFLLLQDKFVVDVYSGGGVKLSQSDTQEERSRYSMGAYDYASSKTFFIFGLKLGLKLN